MTTLQPLQGIDIYLLDQFFKGRLTPGMTVLDAGCGYGRNIRWLISQGYSVTAVDANPEVIGRLKAEFAQQKDSFSTARIEEYPATTQYDFVICNAVLHFAAGHDQFNAMFRQLVQLTRPGGILFIRMTSNIGLETQLAPGNEGVYALPDGSTRYLITREQVDELVQGYGLQLIEHVKTVFVDGLRSMTTLVFRR